MAKFTIEDVRNRAWQLYGLSAAPLYVSIFAPDYARGFLQRYGVGVDVASVSKAKQIQWYIDGAQFTALAEKVLPMLLQQQWGYYERWEKEAAAFEEFHYDFMKMDLHLLSDTELQKLMRDYREIHSKQFVTNNIIEAVSFYFQHTLEDQLVSEGVDSAEAFGLTHDWGQAARPNYLKLAVFEYKQAKTPEEVSRVLEKYHYLNTDYLGPKQVSENDLKQLANMNTSVAAPTASTQLPKLVRDLLTVLQMIATIQDLRKAQFLMMVWAARRFAEEYAKHCGISVDDLEFATWKEIEERTVDGASLPMRKEEGFTYWDADSTTVYTGDEAQTIADAFQKYVLSPDQHATEVRGFCASKGKVSGRAVIVLSTHEFHKVKEGDIIIAIMTRPEYMPVMHKAAAFVCDEGGITSHAAIVAREMKKPCVIGTRIGTQVFKDGDMVEVDAEKGIVRKLDK